MTRLRIICSVLFVDVAMHLDTSKAQSIQTVLKETRTPCGKCLYCFCRKAGGTGPLDVVAHPLRMHILFGHGCEDKRAICKSRRVGY